MILDLFAGPGGWDVGLSLLELDATGIEIDEWACATRAKAGLTTVRADVSTLDPGRFEGVTGLIASPPCQDWSVAGNLTRKDGHTGWLVDEPERYVEALRPIWVAQEQVIGALPVWEEQARYYQTLGYNTWTGILTAEQYGVAQTRQRAILMAHLERPVLPPEPTHQRYVHGQPAMAEHGLFGTIRPWISMAEALGWADGSPLDWPDPHLHMKGSNLRPTSRRVTEPAQALAFGHNSAGWQWGDGPQEVKPSRVTEDAWPFFRPATTVMGDHRIFSPGGHIANDGRNNDYMVGRSDQAIKIEPWEAAVLQSFPADYPFAGARTRVFGQVGDAVPPLLSAAIVGELTGRPWQDTIARLLYPEEFSD